MFEHLDEVLIPPDSTVEQAMQHIDQTAHRTDGVGVVFVVDTDRSLLGVLTDGDIRRSLLAGANLETRVSEVMNPSPTVAPIGASPHLLLRLFDNRLKQIPVVDEDGSVVDLLLYSRFSVVPSGTPLLIRAKAPVRLSFAGGGTDLTRHFGNGGGAVVSATIDRYCQATLLRRNDRRITIRSLDLDQYVELDSLDEVQYDGTLDLIKAAIRVVRPQFGFDLTTESDVPPGTGLGGSSSMAVAVVSVLYRLVEGELEEYRIADLAYQAERVELGILGGWQDQYAAAFGGFNFMEFTPGNVLVHPLRISDRVRLELESNLLICFTGRTRDSGELHTADQGSRLETDRSAELHHRMLELAQETRDALLTGQMLRFGHLLNEAWETKKRYGGHITNDRVDDLHAVARANGAIGGKLLGAGGGGYLLFYCDPLQRHRTIEALAAEGAENIGFQFDERGVRVWRSEHIGGEPDCTP